jgi:hypothetical protein
MDKMSQKSNSSPAVAERSFQKGKGKKGKGKRKNKRKDEQRRRQCQ